jgi:uncharacterized protein YjiS (DUF1127 family)
MVVVRDRCDAVIAVIEPARGACCQAPSNGGAARLSTGAAAATPNLFAPGRGQRPETSSVGFAGRHRRITSVTSFFAELWSKLCERREIHRIRAAWETIDDRTLKDIGVSRYEIEYARDARHWR